MRINWKGIVFLCTVILILAASPYLVGLAGLPQTKEEHIAEAKKQVALENFWRAKDHYRQAIKLDPNDPELFYARGYSNLQLEYYDEAIEDFSRCLEMDPSRGNAYFNRGVALGHSGLYRAALQDFSRVIELAPNDVAAYRERGLTREKLGDKFGALDDFRFVVRANPNFALGQISLARALLNTGNSAQALKHYNRAVSIRPELKENFEIATGGCFPFFDTKAQKVVLKGGECP